MRRIIFYLIVLTSALFSANIDNNKSYVYYKAPVSVAIFADDKIVGKNKNISGYINLENSTGEIKISSDEFASENKLRDKHIQEILNTANMKYIVFHIDKVELANNIGTIYGILNINNISKNVAFDVKMTQNGTENILNGKATIKYSLFGINQPSVAGGVVKKAKETLDIGIVAYLKDQGSLHAKSLT